MLQAFQAIFSLVWQQCMGQSGGTVGWVYLFMIKFAAGGFIRESFQIPEGGWIFVFLFRGIIKYIYIKCERD